MITVGNDITRYTGDLSGPNKYLAHLSTPIDAKDVDNPVNISACTPSAQDFPNLFNRLQTQTGYNDLSKKLVFWSGVTEEEAQQFAISKNRYTVGMLIKKTKWEPCGKTLCDNRPWSNMTEAVNRFWIPLSKAFAKFATDSVDVLFTEERAQEQQNTTSCIQPVWCSTEKGILINSTTVTSINKHIRYPISIYSGQIKKNTTVKAEQRVGVAQTESQ